MYGIFRQKKKQSETPISEQEDQTLSDVIRGMQHCVNTAAEITEAHYLNQMTDYFDETAIQLCLCTAIFAGRS